MSPAPTTDLGVIVGPTGYPIHRTACDECNGTGSVLCEEGPPHAPRDYRIPCEARGCKEGVLEDEGCGCDACIDLAEREDTRRDVEKTRKTG